MKVCVYAIAKNESAFVSRWLDSMSEADGIFVLDTGSTDGTAELLRAGGATVAQQTVSPWRFDEARNISLEMVDRDADICVCTDLDEVFSPGWRAQMERAWSGKVNLLSVRYVWSHVGEKEGVVFRIKKTHSRDGFYWKGMVHETVQPRLGVEAVEAEAEGVTLSHYPDQEKSRAQYLPLLEQSVLEEPDNDRNMHYLGREYMFYRMYDKAIATLTSHLSMPSATWDEERCASMRYIARCYAGKSDMSSAWSWFLRAVAEYPHSREPFIELGTFLYSVQDYDGAVWAMKRAVAIEKPSRSYINEPKSFSALPYDVLSIALYKTGNLSGALEAAEQALALEPDDQRIAANVEFFRNSAANTR